MQASPAVPYWPKSFTTQAAESRNSAASPLSPHPTTSRPPPESYLHQHPLLPLVCTSDCPQTGWSINTIHIRFGVLSFSCRLLSLLFPFVLASPLSLRSLPFLLSNNFPYPTLSLSTCFFVAPTSFLGCAATNHVPNCTTQLSPLRWSASCSLALSCFLLLLIYPVRAVRWTF